jgi:hypothetical protein
MQRTSCPLRIVPIPYRPGENRIARQPRAELADSAAAPPAAATGDAGAAVLDLFSRIPH